MFTFSASGKLGAVQSPACRWAPGSASTSAGATFLAVSALGIVGGLGVAALEPGKLTQPPTAGLGDQIRVLAKPRLLLAFAITALGCGSTFVAFTFTADSKIPALITLAGMGALAFANVPGLQLYVVQLAQRHAPGAVDVASALNIAAFNLGIAAGAFFGGQVVASPLGLGATPWVGGLFVLGGLALTLWSGALDRHDHRAMQAAQVRKGPFRRRSGRAGYGGDPRARPPGRAGGRPRRAGARVGPVLTRFEERLPERWPFLARRPQPTALRPRDA